MIGALLITALAVTFISTWLSSAIPEMLRDREYSHMVSVSQSFADLQRAVQEEMMLLSMESLTGSASGPHTRTITFRLNSEPLPIFGGATTGSLTVDGGRVSFYSPNPNYVPQEWIYENGAVILVQGGVPIMRSAPSMIDVKESGGNTLRVTVQKLYVDGFSRVAGSGSAGLEVSLENVSEKTWNRRRQITISGSHPENYQIRIVLPFYDPSIRFLENQNSGSLSYWVENWTPDNMTVWVRREENSDSTIWVYYGNPDAGSASSLENVFIANSIYGVSGTYSGSGVGNYIDDHTEADYVRGNYPVDLYQGYVTKIDWGSLADGSSFNSSVRNQFYCRFRFLFLPDVSGTWTFGTDSDDASELIVSAGDMYGGVHEHSVVAKWYGSHGVANSLTQYTGTLNLEAGKGIWLEYLYQDWDGGEGGRAGAQKPGGTMMIINTTNFPNQIFARKYVSPEPTVTVGAEEIVENVAVAARAEVAVGSNLSAWGEYFQKVSDEINQLFGANSTVVQSPDNSWVKLVIDGRLTDSTAPDIILTYREVEVSARII